MYISNASGDSCFDGMERHSVRQTHVLQLPAHYQQTHCQIHLLFKVAFSSQPGTLSTNSLAKHTTHSSNSSSAHISLELTSSSTLSSLLSISISKEDISSPTISGELSLFTWQCWLAMLAGNGNENGNGNGKGYKDTALAMARVEAAMILSVLLSRQWRRLMGGGLILI